MAITPSPSSSYVSWGAILAGSVLAGAFSLVMLQFGSAIGLSADALLPTDNVVLTPQRVFMIGFWILWIQVLASAAGGYIAGRLRTPWADLTAHESEVRDGAHGLLVWATATLAVFAATGLAAALAALAPDVAEPVVRQTPEMIEHQKTVRVITAFATGATSLASGVVAWWTATCGGDHRDSGRDLSQFLSLRR